MNETLDFSAYLSYFLIAAYYMIMLRLWLPPPSDKRHETGDDEPAVVPDGNTSRAALRPMTLVEDTGEPEPLTKISQPAGPLERVRAADEHFDEHAFLSGASRAYELVVKAYAEGDTLTLNGLLDPEVAATFSRAIHERREKGENITLDFVCIRELDIVDVWLEADQAEITVRFVSELIAATRANNAVIDGDPERIVAVTDLWTFARHIPSSNPNWRIVATQGS